ncbi:hypothetical protein BCEP4_290032 [Burkholderia cepacia]|nr:hypothetical protein BCEP4_290032 [Burkholderia cepacia]
MPLRLLGMDRPRHYLVSPIWMNYSNQSHFGQANLIIHIRSYQ